MTQNFPKSNEIFIVGGQPTVTYNPRNNLSLEKQLREYLDTGYKLLSITGSTKCGKTVLCRKVVPREKGIWTAGGYISNENDLWNLILDNLDIYTTINNETGETQSKSSTAGMKAGINLGVGSIGGNGSSTEGLTTTRKVTSIRQSSPRVSALNALLDSKAPLIIDDFHYINKEIQKSIVRALKDPIFEGLRVILIAVPHRAYDALSVESEMTGRLMHLKIPIWQPYELNEIPNKGFSELNAYCSKEIVDRFTEESFGSPHLMQEFCLKLCRENDLIQKSTDIIELKPPTNYVDFFRDVAASASRIAFERLARGPRSRTDRVPRKFSDGSEGDIYIAILRAIAVTGPKIRLTYEEIRSALQRTLVERIPQANEITRVLSYMSEIAKRDLEGEPVIDWDQETSTLYIADPFFAFYLRWCSDQTSNE